MKTVVLGNTGEMISSIALGTMYFGTRTGEKTSFEILDYYASCGGRFLDTANKYASWITGCKGGESESLIGKWLKGRQDKSEFFISTKVGFSYGDIPRSLNKQIVIAECEKSLSRLGVDTIDLYFAHAWDQETPVEEMMEAFFSLQKQGKIRYAGASNFYSWHLSISNCMARSQGWEGFVCLQQRHSYLEPNLWSDFGNQHFLTPDIADYCINHNITLMAYSPLLSGAYSRSDREIPEQYNNHRNLEKTKVAMRLADQLGYSVNSVVLAWLMQNTPKTIPVLAAGSLDQMIQNLSVTALTLTEAQIQMMNLSQDVLPSYLKFS